MSPTTYVLTLCGTPSPGELDTIAGWIGVIGATRERESWQDPDTDRLYLRCVFDSFRHLDDLRAGFVDVARRSDLTWNIHSLSVPRRIAVLGSREPHCVQDLLHRQARGDLPHTDIAVIISNHRDLAGLAAERGVPFVHVPYYLDHDAGRADGDRRLLATLREYRVDLVVLARWMVVLGRQVCQEYPWRILNVHHALLPAFPGARPHHQAAERGVRIHGATAHLVGPDAQLDQGPYVIQRAAESCAPRPTAAELRRANRPLEAGALAEALKLLCAHRVLLADSHRAVILADCSTQLASTDRLPAEPAPQIIAQLRRRAS